jgi:hypothetical protein
MSLALAAAISSILLLITSQIKRRMQSKNPVLDGVITALIVIVVALVGAYFYQRFVS